MFLKRGDFTLILYYPEGGVLLGANLCSSFVVVTMVDVRFLLTVKGVTCLGFLGLISFSVLYGFPD